MRVKVYYNIRKHCLSVMDKATRRVIKHTNAITLMYAKFVVSQKGVQRIRKNKRKAVVAFVEGDVNSYTALDVNGERVTFNPYKWETFVTALDERPIHNATYVSIDGKNIIASDI